MNTEPLIEPTIEACDYDPDEIITDPNLIIDMLPGHVRPPLTRGQRDRMYLANGLRPDEVHWPDTCGLAGPG